MKNADQEILKHLQWDSENSRFLLTEPHLLYLTRAQSQSYLDAMGNPEYSSGFHSATVEVIKANLPTILGKFTRKVSLIDLGPGYPDKSLPIGEYLKKNKAELYYYPVDVSDSFLGLACRYMRPFAANVVPIESRFEDCVSKLPQEAAQYELFVLIGLTFMNFHHSIILTLLNQIKGPSGKVILAAELLQENAHMEDVLQRYKSDAARDVAFGPLRHLRMRPEDADHLVSFHNSRIEMSFKLRGAIPPVLANKGVKSGDTIVTAVSYRYRMFKLQSLCKQYFSKFEIFTSKDNSTAVALCQ
ncbi:MAG: L-histidine N(alpha)-methyltransferase [Elusimicrobia bacterium]|nr:L-histidine N(alpha)-methyltransferase [Elusimicrobiota bacterium]